MLDLELLKTLLCVVDEGSFTRAAERVHRTQSTVSQQVRKLEDTIGHVLLLRDRSGSHATPTAQGELLSHYARRLLALAQEAEEAVASDVRIESVRVGVPEDFDARKMAAILSGFIKARPDVRLETVAGMSTDLHRKLAAGEIEIALVKREPGSGECHACWPESLVWVSGQSEGEEPNGEDWMSRNRSDRSDGSDPIPLALFPHGCLYRQRAIRSLDKAQRRWRIAFGSQSLTGIQAAVASGLAISVLPTTAVLPEHRICQGLPELPPTELALVSASSMLDATQRALVDFLAGALGNVSSDPPGRSLRALNA